MSLSAVEITGTTWTALTTAGQSGSAWLKEGSDSNGFGEKDIRIWHGASAPTGDTELELSKRIYTPAGNSGVMVISNDSASDIYYARGYSADDGATVIVDVV